MTVLDKRQQQGLRAVVGDIHGASFTLLDALLPALGFAADGSHPEGMKLTSVGDLTDRGGQLGVESSSVASSGAIVALKWAMDWSSKGILDVTSSNHGKKLARKLETGERIDPKTNAAFNSGLGETLADLDAYENELRGRRRASFSAKVVSFLKTRPSLIRYSGGPSGEFIVAHAACKPEFLNPDFVWRTADKDYCIFPREFEWLGDATVIVGHVMTDDVLRQRAVRMDGSVAGEVIRIDTGAFAGGGLTAYLPHEDRYVTVPTDSRDLPDEARSNRNRWGEQF